MYRSRRSKLPTLPMYQEDVRIEGRWQKTLSGEQFYLRKEGEVLIFATHANMCQALRRSYNKLCGRTINEPHLPRHIDVVQSHPLYSGRKSVQGCFIKSSSSISMSSSVDNSSLLCMGCYLQIKRRIPPFFHVGEKSDENWSTHLSRRNHG